MKTFIFTNTNSSIAMMIAKALHEYSKIESSYYAIFDREYDILINDKKISSKFYTLDDRHIYQNIISKNKCVLLDFDLDFSVHAATNYGDYIRQKLQLDAKEEFPPLEIYTTTSQAVKVKKLLDECNRHNFSHVLYAPYNLDVPKEKYEIFDDDKFYDTTLSSFTPEIAEQIENFLADRVNLVKLLPNHIKQHNISEIHYLVRNVDFVISNVDIIHAIATDLNKPGFLNIARFTKDYSQYENCSVYDPQRNAKKPLPSGQFSKDYQHVIGFNNQVLFENFDEIKSELLRSLDKNKIAYK